MKPYVTLRINRTGKFTVDSESEHISQCAKFGTREYNYHVAIEANNNKLTPQGFVMDNKVIFDYFQDTYTINKAPCVSCEMMAEAAIEYFIHRFQNDPDLQGIRLQKVYVKIQGADVSYIEAEWIIDFPLTIDQAARANVCETHV